MGRKRDGDRDEVVFLFVKMLAGKRFEDSGNGSLSLEERLRKAIREALSPRHVPGFILAVEDIPKTVNGKKVEIAVKQIISGRDVEISSTVANPETLRGYKRFRDVEGVRRSSKL